MNTYKIRRAMYHIVTALMVIFLLGMAGLVLALVSTVVHAQSAPYRLGEFPRDPATAWPEDAAIAMRAIRDQATFDAFGAFQPTSAPDYVDSNYVAVGVTDVYPVILTYNNNFGASKGDTLVVCGFRNDGEFVLSQWARQVDFQFSYDRDLYPQYVWVDPYYQHALQAQLAVRYDISGDWHQVWDSSEWPAPMPYSTSSTGDIGAHQEWREFDLAPRIREGVNFCWRYSFQNPHGYWSGPVINWTWLMDYHTGDFSVDVEDVPMDQEKPLVLYPNPVRDFAYLSSFSEGEDRWELYNLLGQMVTMGDTDQVVVKGFPSGVYAVRVVRADGRTESTRLTVLR